jgi:Spy/CpxP family protein refolding chaperone
MAVMAAVMFVAVSQIAKAQDPAQQGRGRGRGGVGMLIGNLGLDSATTAKINEIAQKYGQETMKLRQDAQAAGGQVDQAKVTEINNKRNEEIKALLNADQKAKFDENVKNAPQGRRGAPPPVR